MKYRNLEYNWDNVPVIVDLPMAARILGLTVETLKRYAQQGTFPAFKTGRAWRVTKKALFKWINDNSAMPGYADLNVDEGNCA